MPYRPPTEPTWTFLSNHAHVLLCLARDPTLRIRDIADLVGITERTTSAILDDLEHTGYLTRHRVGRRSHYSLKLDLPLRHPIEKDHAVGELLRTLATSTVMPPTERAVVSPVHVAPVPAGEEALDGADGAGALARTRAVRRVKV